MKKIILFLLLVIPLEMVVAQDDDPTDFLKKVEASKGRVLTALSKKTREYEKQLYDEYMQKKALEEAEANNVIDEIKNLPEYQSGTLAESRRRAARLRHEMEISLLPDKAKRMAEDEFYKELRNKYSNGFYSFNNEDYLFIEAAQPVIEASENPQLERDRIKEAAEYIKYFKNNNSDYFSVSFRRYSSGYTSSSDLHIEDVYLNIDKYRNIYNDILNEKQRENEEKEATEKRSKTIKVVVVLGIALFIIIGFTKLKKRRETK